MSVQAGIPSRVQPHPQDSNDDMTDPTTGPRPQMDMFAATDPPHPDDIERPQDALIAQAVHLAPWIDDVLQSGAGDRQLVELLGRHFRLERIIHHPEEPYALTCGTHEDGTPYACIWQLPQRQDNPIHFGTGSLHLKVAGRGLASVVRRICVIPYV